jgi:hypothetical protein
MSLLRADLFDDGSVLPRILVQARPLDGTDAVLTILHAAGNVAASSTSAIDFESDPVGLWRSQLNLSNARLGTTLPESTVTEPFLSEGRVRFFARIGGRSAGRFLVKSEQLDPEDIVRLDTDRRCPLTWGDLLRLRILSNRNCLNSLVGPITLEETGGQAPDTFEVTLHTNRPSLPIERPRGGHIIRVSNWEIVSAQPALVAIWAAFISLMLIVSYIEGHRSPRFARAAARRGRSKSKTQRAVRPNRRPDVKD